MLARSVYVASIKTNGAKGSNSSSNSGLVQMCKKVMALTRVVQTRADQDPVHQTRVNSRAHQDRRKATGHRKVTDRPRAIVRSKDHLTETGHRRDLPKTGRPKATALRATDHPGRRSRVKTINRLFNANTKAASQNRKPLFL